MPKFKYTPVDLFTQLGDLYQDVWPSGTHNNAVSKNEPSHENGLHVMDRTLYNNTGVDGIQTEMPRLYY